MSNALKMREKQKQAEKKGSGVLSTFYLLKKKIRILKKESKNSEHIETTDEKCAHHSKLIKCLSSTAAASAESFILKKQGSCRPNVTMKMIESATD